MAYEWLKHIEFKNYWLLPALFLLPVIIYLYYRNRRLLRVPVNLTTTRTIPFPTFKTRMLMLPFWLRILALACLILALARPQINQVQNRTKGKGIDIILCMDVSGSMLSTDFLPNRLEVAKQIASEFVEARPVDEIGLVIFSGESYSLFPLSTDHESLLGQIANLRSGMLEDGTVIGEGLSTSVSRLSAGKERSKIIILLTDGKEEPPDTRLIDPITALEIVKAKRIKVYTIGMGAMNAKVIHEKGVPVVSGSSFLDENLLRKIAGETGGQYYRAVDKESLAEIYGQINRLEKSNVEVVTRTRHEEEFPVLLLAALGFLVAELILKYTYLRTLP